MILILLLVILFFFFGVSGCYLDLPFLGIDLGPLVEIGDHAEPAAAVLDHRPHGPPPPPLRLLGGVLGRHLEVLLQKALHALPVALIPTDSIKQAGRSSSSRRVTTVQWRAGAEPFGKARLCLRQRSPGNSSGRRQLQTSSATFDCHCNPPAYSFIFVVTHLPTRQGVWRKQWSPKESPSHKARTHAARWERVGIGLSS
ncbi:hypothetical protein BHM03_00051689 [Ensete ventricosum]|nr:hypothetical protein BHM03_00051689 [Ensete ventricosum]